MSWLEALILGLVQGLTEYLPVSSSGHLELGKVILGVDAEAGGLMFDVLVHVATVLATLVILWREIIWLFKGLFKFKWNAETKYVVAILISMIPIGIVGVCFKDAVEALYSGHILTVVGVCLLVTAALLFLSEVLKSKTPGAPTSSFPIPLPKAFVVGLAQACAVLPGLSRSGSTIATGLLLGIPRERLAEFSFIMVIPPILGEALLDSKDLLAMGAGASTTSAWVLLIGFLAAFISGCFACKWMIALVKKCKLRYFALYCAIIGIIALICA